MSLFIKCDSLCTTNDGRVTGIRVFGIQFVHDTNVKKATDGRLLAESTSSTTEFLLLSRRIEQTCTEAIPIPNWAIRASIGTRGGAAGETAGTITRNGRGRASGA